MEVTIEVSGLRKRFGATLALDGMSFTVTPGHVTGFIGPNGAGKSTLLTIAGSLEEPTSGEVLVCGMALGGCRGAGVPGCGGG
jgi:ABC-2 type transport system ATP-binding protein